MLPTIAAIETSGFTDEADIASTAYGYDLTDDGTTVSWKSGADEDAVTHHFTYLSKSDEGLGTRYVIQDDITALVRDLDPYDGVTLAAGAGVAQPVEVLRAEVARGGGVVAQELNAVVAADNTVVTLLLETDLGLYVRYSGDWQLLSDTSDALDGLEFLEVSPKAVEVFDKADMANKALSAFDLPRTEQTESGKTVDILPEPVGLPLDLPNNEGMIVASGVAIPSVDTEDDLDVAISFAKHNPTARWYISKRAAALGLSERVPAEWSSHAVVTPFQ